MVDNEAVFIFNATPCSPDSTTRALTVDSEADTDELVHGKSDPSVVSINDIHIFGTEPAVGTRIRFRIRLKT